ncbi:tRNA pseudouridine(55) synthase TruB [Holdemanella biformis]
MDGILIIDKPYGMTSHDVVNWLRKKYKQKKFGHTGTLDPNATGVLVVLCGKSCKLLQFLSDTDKEYIGQIEFGKSTSTDDIWGKVEAEKEVNLDFSFSEELQKFVGRNHQLVPKTSNKKVNGKKLMDYQREGLEVPKVYSDIEIYSMEDLGDYRFKVACSSGTYVRSICRDLALNTNNLGCMKSLRRTKVGRFTIDQAQTLEDLETHEPVLYPSIYVLDHLDKINYQPIEDVYQGKRIRLDNSNNEVCILDAGKPIAIYEKEREGLFKSKRGLW